MFPSHTSLGAFFAPGLKSTRHVPVSHPLSVCAPCKSARPFSLSHSLFGNSHSCGRRLNEAPHRACELLQNKCRGGGKVRHIIPTRGTRSVWELDRLTNSDQGRRSSLSSLISHQYLSFLTNLTQIPLGQRPKHLQRPAGANARENGAGFRLRPL